MLANLPDILRLGVVLLALAASGCVSVRYDVARLTDPARVTADADTSAHFARRDELAARIMALGHGVDAAEAQRVAEVALVYPMQLAVDYELTQPAITHNMLVNVGLKPRGLCIHWTEDMLTALAALELQTLDLYWGVAYPTRPLRLEHSSPVVTARGEAFETGLLLDAWRDSGNLYYGPVATDRRYAWQRLPNLITDPPATSRISGPR